MSESVLLYAQKNLRRDVFNYKRAGTENPASRCVQLQESWHGKTCVEMFSITRVLERVTGKGMKAAGETINTEGE